MAMHHREWRYRLLPALVRLGGWTRRCLAWWSRAGRFLGRTAHLMVGMPDYDVYVEHMRTRHPERPVMSYSEFFRERQEARYGGGKGRPVRCC